MAGVLIPGIAVRNLNNTGPTKMKWSEIYPCTNWSIEEPCDYTTLDSTPSQIEFVDEGILLCWVEPSDEGITVIQGTPSATTAVLLCLFFSTRSKAGRMVKLEAAGQPSWGTLQGKGQLGQGGKRNGADGRVHELGGMKRQNVLPKTGKILMRRRKCPVTLANNRICILLHPWEIRLYKAFSIPTRKKRLGFAYSTSSHRECSWSPPSYNVKDAVDRFQETINYSSPNDTSSVAVPLPPSCISK